jgi:sigma-B regulation protein RsbU (phosphoserine phosphatase)
MEMQILSDGKFTDWQDRLAHIVTTMREMSRQTDPQAMVRAYGQRMRELMPTDRMVSLSRRDLESPQYRITRSSLWKDELNPWKDVSKLPLFDRGLLGELLYGDEPRIIDELQPDPADPAFMYLDGMGSLIATPLYDKGVALNMVVLMRQEPFAFNREQLPEWVWLSNLFGQATHNLILSEKLKRAYNALDSEVKIIAEIQKSLLPTEVPQIPGLELAVHYKPARRAGGDYYDFFSLPDNKWGIWIADVSGHDTPAAVLMAITHSIAHVYPGPPPSPGKMLKHVNHHLATRYTQNAGTFVTAFYGIFDPANRQLTYACAGHNPPRLKRCGDGTRSLLDGVQSLPLGVSADENFKERTLALVPGDQVIFYTDGITDATNPAGEMFGLERLDLVLEECSEHASDLLKEVMTEIDLFTDGRAAADDRTLIVAKVL